MAYTRVLRKPTVCRHWTLDRLPRPEARPSPPSARVSSDIRRHGQSNFGTISTQADSFQDHVHLIIVPLRL
ncbi:unnamed protein product [Parnassius mnemosyne]|uniref:Uncharacterized protein n=1 Tax=Parnassius mnemosyne TaxID=213953 RepID=A0AAV1M786_9NEOP